MLSIRSVPVGVGSAGARPAIRDVFVGDIGKITFTRDPGGKISGFRFDADRIQNVRFPEKTN
jgi:hypothetical protein